jgi:hypothetical protein
LFTQKDVQKDVLLLGFGKNMWVQSRREGAKESHNVLVWQALPGGQ